MLELADSWVWDFWLAEADGTHHLFFLFASRALGDQHRRHRRASIGHAISTDLHNWTRVADALVRSDPPAPDSIATWTGSVLRGDDGIWRLYYTGCGDEPVSTTQRVMVATSTDLHTWQKSGTVEAAADSRWYLTGKISAVEAFRDPWVFRHGGAWHMITTASARDAAPDECGVLGHATSVDLERWETLPPLTEPGSGFAQLEVPQIVEIDGRYLLVFSCLGPELAPWRQQRFGGGGVWVASAAGPLGPFDLDGARLLTNESRYAGKVVSGRDGTLVFLAFENFVGEEFIGRLADPVDFRELLGNAGLGLEAAPGNH